MYHSKLDLEQAREFIRLNFNEIDSSDDVILPTVKRSVDWGSRKGQGKRAGHTVKGGMACCDLKGIKIYIGLDFHDYYIEKFKDDFSLIAKEGKIVFYAKAREWGASHIQSMIFAIWKGQGKKL
jgi:hypothetical protein